MLDFWIFQVRKLFSLTRVIIYDLIRYYYLFIECIVKYCFDFFTIIVLLNFFYYHMGIYFLFITSFIYYRDKTFLYLSYLAYLALLELLKLLAQKQRQRPLKLLHLLC